VDLVSGPEEKPGIFIWELLNRAWPSGDTGHLDLDIGGATN